MLTGAAARLSQLGLLVFTLLWLGGTAAAGPGGSVTGLVRDSAGKLLPGARVQLRLGRLTTTTNVDADGVFRFTQLPAASGYSLRATLRRHDPAELESLTVQSGESLRVDLALTRSGRAAAGKIAGTIRDANGVTVAGARVEILSGPSDARATTSRAGKFRLRGLARGQYALTVSAPRMSTRVVEEVSVDGNRGPALDVELEPVDEQQLGAFLGAVKDQEGHPIPGALLEIVAGPGTGQTTAGEGGRYELLSLAAGTYSVRASAEGFWGSTWDGVDLPLGHEVRVDFALHRQEAATPGRISGRVSDAEGHALAGAHVALVEADVERGATTDKEGHYTLSELSAGPYRVRASKEGYVPTTHDGRVETGAVLTLNFALSAEPSPTGSLAGRVSSGEGLAVSGVLIKVLEGPQVSSNGEGGYRIEGLAAGQRTVRFSKEGFHTAERSGVTIHAGETTTLNVTLEREPPPMGVLAGQVTEANGTPVVGALVKIVEGPQATTNAEGRYRIEGLPAGLRSVRVSRDGFHTAERSGVTIHAGETTTLNVTLEREPPPPGRLVGRVSDQGSALPIQGALVRVLEGPHRSTGVEGGYEFEGLVPGTYTLRVSREGYLTVDRTAVVVSGESTRLDVQLTHVD